MLSREDNELMCRVGPATAMGKAMRRYWMPALLSSELPEPDGDPRRVQLLGEFFVVFRDTEGKVGFLREHCCHRGASLMLGRVEGCGIRCIYHGWKFAVDGTVMDTPNVADPAFKTRFKAKAYPVREAGGFVWVYLGPADQEPAFPDLPFFHVPPSNRLNAYAAVNCNYVQVIEGLVDSSHLSTLHTSPLKRTNASELDFAKKTSHMQFDAAPALEADDTDFGFHYVAKRRIETPDGVRVLARIAAFVAPCFLFNPNGDLFFAIVPVNDERCLFHHVWWDRDRKFGEEPLRSEQLEFVGLDPEALDNYGLSQKTWNSPDRARAENNYLQDREAQRKGHYTGLPSFTQEDAAVSMSAGGIRDRSAEVLSTADIAVARLYRTLLSCARSAESDRDPVGLHADSSAIVGTSGSLLPDEDWRTLAPRHRILRRDQTSPAAAE